MRFRTVLLVLMLYVTGTIHAQTWHRTSNNEFLSMAFNGHAIVGCDTANDLTSQFYSLDHGVTWTRSEHGCPRMLEVVALGTNFYGASYSFSTTGVQSTIWRSTDDGYTWDSLWGVEGFGQLYTTANVIAYDYGYDIAISTDGQTFTPLPQDRLPIDSSLPNPHQHPGYLVCASDSMLVAMTSYYPFPRKQFLSYDLGATWIERPLPDSQSFYTFGAYNTNTLLTASDTSLYRSTDTGRTWSRIGKYATALRSESDIMVWSDNISFSLSRDGQTFLPLDTSGMSRWSIRSFVIAGNYLVVSQYPPAVYYMQLGASSVTPIETAGLALYPNPANDVLHLEGIPELASVQIIDAFGRLVLSSRSVNGTVDINTLPQGTYILLVSGGRFRFVK